MLTLIDNIWFSLTAELAKEFAQRKIGPEALDYRSLRHEVSEKRDFERRFKPKRTGADVDMGITSAAQAEALARGTQEPPSSASEPQYYPLSPHSRELQATTSTPWEMARARVWFAGVVLERDTHKHCVPASPE